METEEGNNNSTSDALSDIQFGDVFNLEDIQRIQDLFSDASGVASIITHLMVHRLLIPVTSADCVMTSSVKQKKVLKTVIILMQ